MALAVRGEDGGVGVGTGKEGLRVCRMKACSVLLGVKGIIMQTMGKERGKLYAKEKKRNKMKQ